MNFARFYGIWCPEQNADRLKRTCHNSENHIIGARDKGLQVLQTNFIYALVLMFKPFITRDIFISLLPITCLAFTSPYRPKRQQYSRIYRDCGGIQSYLTYVTGDCAKRDSSFLFGKSVVLVPRLHQNILNF